MIHGLSMNPTQENILFQLIQTVHRLRAPGGCPWDRSQTHQTLRPYLIEEAYEVLDVLDQIETENDLKIPKIRNDFREELGDLLMQVLLHSEMTREAGAFDIYDVAHALQEKLIRRHPHVFGEIQAHSTESALQNWEQEKAKEKKSKLGSGILEGLPKNLPALQRTARVIEKVTQVGFQWKDIEGPLDKLQEELNELKAEVLKLEKEKTKHPNQNNPKNPSVELAAELGDLLFSVCNIAHHFKISPEDALRQTVFRFEKRFRHVENRLKTSGKSPKESNLEEMDQFWNEAKQLEKIQILGLTGGIASGKSTVARIFLEQGIPVIDADQISRELSSEKGLAYPTIIEQLGTGNRKKLRELIFFNEEAKQKLEAILHPLIYLESLKKIQQFSKTQSLIVYEASLIVETGRYRDFNQLILVETTKENQIQRLISRDQIDPELAEKMINSQASLLEKRKYATWILDNSDSIDHLKARVFDFIRKIKSHSI